MEQKWTKELITYCLHRLCVLIRILCCKISNNTNNLRRKWFWIGSDCWNSTSLCLGGLWERFERFERYFTLKKHKAPGACTKLPRRLVTNLRYETKPSRPVVGNTKLQSFIGYCPTTRRPPRILLFERKTDRKNKLLVHSDLQLVSSSCSTGPLIVQLVPSDG